MVCLSCYTFYKMFLISGRFFTVLIFIESNYFLWASLLTQLVKNPPAMQETRFNSWVEKIPGEGIGYPLQYSWASLIVNKESTCNAGDLAFILGWEDPLGKGTAPHSRILAWRIPRTEEAGGLRSMGSQRVRHD